MGSHGVVPAWLSGRQSRVLLVCFKGLYDIFL